ncbi:MAG: hypothetical protein RL222_1222, partial [Bacteroidota bacterium]
MKELDVDASSVVNLFLNALVFGRTFQQDI